MGREIRRVPLDWEHPKKRNAYTGQDEYQPMFDKTLAIAIRDWEAARETDYHGSLIEQLEDGYSSPDPAHYRPDWGTASLGYAMYETVSEGTPVTPTFATPEELVDYLVAYGTYWDQNRETGGWRREAAEEFVASGWAPSFVGIPGVGLLEGARDADQIEATR